jgi:hypothetical protein
MEVQKNDPSRSSNQIKDDWLHPRLRALRHWYIVHAQELVCTVSARNLWCI